MRDRGLGALWRRTGCGLRSGRDARTFWSWYELRYIGRGEALPGRRSVQFDAMRHLRCQHNTIASGELGLIDRHVGLVDQASAIVRIARIGGHAQTQRDPDGRRASADGDVGLLHGAPQAFGKDAGLLAFHLGSTRTNSSPPKRAAMSYVRVLSRRILPMWANTASPARCP